MIWMIITTIIATLGFILASISLGWQISTYHKTHEERIKGKLSITIITIRPSENVPVLHLEIWNDGHIPVYIKSVTLNWGDEEPKLGNVLHSLSFQGYPPLQGPLQPGDGKSYILPPIAATPFDVVSKQPVDRVWISIRSQKKEVLRLHGDDLKAYLSKIVEVTDKKEKNDES